MEDSPNDNHVSDVSKEVACNNTPRARSPMLEHNTIHERATTTQEAHRLEAPVACGAK